MFAYLWIGEAVVAIAAMETRIARCLPFAKPTEECLEGPVHAQHHVLQHLGINIAIFRHRLLDAGQFCLLLIVGDGDATLPPCLTPLPNSSVVDMAAELQNVFKFLVLMGVGLSLYLKVFRIVCCCITYYSA